MFGPSQRRRVLDTKQLPSRSSATCGDAIRFRRLLQSGAARIPRTRRQDVQHPRKSNLAPTRIPDVSQLFEQRGHPALESVPAQCFGETKPPRSSIRPPVGIDIDNHGNRNGGHGASFTAAGSTYMFLRGIQHREDAGNDTFLPLEMSSPDQRELSQLAARAALVDHRPKEPVISSPPKDDLNL